MALSEVLRRQDLLPDQPKLPLVRAPLHPRHLTEVWLLPKEQPS